MLKIVNNPLKSFEYQYVESLQNVIENGIRCKNRTGIDTFALSHQYFLLKANNFPLLKGKKVYPKMALKELFWILLGRSDVKFLQDQGVNYWDEWAFVGMDKNIPQGTIGKSYGYEMRNFNGVDPLKNLLIEMSSKPDSRRLIISLWNHADLEDTTLPPCVCFYHFNCFPSECDSSIFLVDLNIYQRSCDAFLGMPYDAINASYLLNIVCILAGSLSNQKFNFIPINIHYTIGNYHVYENHQVGINKYFENITENRNSIIDQRVKLNIDNNFKLDKIENINQLLQSNVDNKYLSFEIKREYDIKHEYDPIKAQIAI